MEDERPLSFRVERNIDIPRAALGVGSGVNSRSRVVAAVCVPGANVGGRRQLMRDPAAVGQRTRHLVSMAHVPHSEGDEIAATQPTVDAQIEDDELAHPCLNLEADAQRSGVLELEGRILSDDLARAPRLVMIGVGCDSHDGLSSS